VVLQYPWFYKQVKDGGVREGPLDKPGRATPPGYMTMALVYNRLSQVSYDTTSPFVKTSRKNVFSEFEASRREITQ